MASSKTFQGQLHCEKHHLLTCLVCLHSINSVKGGFIPLPEPASRIPCPEQAHSVEPVFEIFRPAARLRGFHDGLSPEDRKKHAADRSTPQDGSNIRSQYLKCWECELTYLFSAGNEKPAPHPSHVGSDGQRYIMVTARPFKFSRSLNRIECSAAFYFASPSRTDAAYDCASKPDSGSVYWNLDNAEIAALVQLLHHVEDELIPHRKKLVEGYVFTNSEYFAGQAWRFQLVVFTSLDREILNFLLRAHQLQYSQKRKAFVERNALGLVTMQYPITEERRYQAVSFIRMVKRLASQGIRVHWSHIKQDKTYIDARERFLHQPPQKGDFRDVGGVWVPNNAKGNVEENNVRDLLASDSFENLPSHEGYEAVERESPRIGSSDGAFDNFYPPDYDAYHTLG
ncbi:hypothetical protein F4781DRAFT_427750 [Annulohypoxylon bovei var. microspora]|nr:hypothetical protein F4781DRAFT_427750 [Annulohypoxylon bovei var. microspora]